MQYSVFTQLLAIANHAAAKSNTANNFMSQWEYQNFVLYSISNNVFRWTFDILRNDSNTKRVSNDIHHELLLSNILILNLNAYIHQYY